MEQGCGGTKRSGEWQPGSDLSSAMRKGAFVCLLVMAAAQGVRAGTVFNPADVDFSNIIDAVDIQLTINGALGIPVEFESDIDTNDMVDAVDVQLVINAALGFNICDVVTCVSIAGPAPLQEALQAVILMENEDSIDLVFGSDGRQRLGDGDADCPGGVPGGNEDFYDFGQDRIPDFAQMALLSELNRLEDPRTVATLTCMKQLFETTEVAVRPSDIFDDLPPFLEGLTLRGTVPSLLGSTLVQLLLEVNLNEREIEAAVDGFSYWAAVDNGHLENIACLSNEVGLLFADLVTAIQETPGTDMSKVVGGDVVLPDGFSVRSKWLIAQGEFDPNPQAGSKLGDKRFVGEDLAFLAAVDAFVASVIEARGGR